MSLLSELLSLNSTDHNRDFYIRAPFGYPGSKLRSLDYLLPHLPYRETYIDVCGGTGSVLLNRRPSQLEVFNERNSGIVSLYRCVRDLNKCKQLLERLELVPPASREEFIWSRENWKHDELDDVERAARWYYSVRHSFNQKGWTFGRSVTGKNQNVKYWSGLKLFWPIHNRLMNVVLENMDWRTILNDFKSGGNKVVWYIDPPYWGTGGNYENEWTKDDHLELCHRVQDLNGGFVALSGYDFPEHPYNTFKFWTAKKSWDVQVSATGLGFTESNHLKGFEEMIQRGKATECLWIYEP